LLVLPSQARFDGVKISTVERNNRLLAVGTERGTTFVSCDEEKWRMEVRVARKGYVGRYVYKYLEEIPVED
jgi:hypothetical protein